MKNFNRLLTLLSLLAAITTISIPERKLLGRMFRNYEANFAKKYMASSEFNYRLEVYEKHMAMIEKFNQSKQSWKKGETIFTDMTDEERKKYTGLFINDKARGLSESNEESSTENAEIIATDDSKPILSGLLGSVTVTINPFSALPQKINWKDAGIMTSVKNQGGCGACWAFSTTALVESLIKRNTGTDTNLSEQELVDCATTSTYVNYGCNGGFTDAALNYYQVKGSHLESQYPYTGKQGACRTLTTTPKKINQYTVVKPKSLVEFLTALSKGPLAVAYAVVNDFYDYKYGVYNHKGGCINETNVNHAVLAVGYDLNPLNPHIVFKNSWSTYFGESGYFRMSMDLIDVGNGPCNLLMFGTSVSATL